MPPLAASKAPLRSAAAPVKAPFSWPNSSLSTSSEGIAPQSTTTKGPTRRAPSSCSARATFSLPVPLSPRISTVAWLFASRSSAEKSARIGTLCPTSLPKWVAPERGCSSFSRPRLKRTVWLPSRSVASASSCASKTRTGPTKVPLVLPRSFSR